jgi:glutathione S-transferase
MRHCGIAFDEVVIPLGQDNTRAELLRFSPSGKCPALRDGEITVWDSLAIIEYLAEMYPDKPLWPKPARPGRRRVRLPPKCIRALWVCAGSCR